MKNSNCKKNILSFILAIITTLCVWHNFLIGGNDILFVFIFISAIFMIKHTIEISNKRQNIIIAVISIVFAIVEVVCKSINKDYTLNNIVNKWLIINIIGYFTIGLCLISHLFYAFEKLQLDNIKIKKIMDNKIMHFLVCALLMIIVWLPVFLRYYPRNNHT